MEQAALESRQKLWCHCTSSRSRPIVDLSHFKGSRVTAPLQKEKKEAILEIVWDGKHTLIVACSFSVVCCKPGWQRQILRWRVKALFFFFTSLSNLELLPHSSDVKRRKKYFKKNQIKLKKIKEAAYGCCIVEKLSLMNQLGS